VHPASRNGPPATTLAGPTAAAIVCAMIPVLAGPALLITLAARRPRIEADRVRRRRRRVPITSTGPVSSCPAAVQQRRGGQRAQGGWGNRAATTAGVRGTRNAHDARGEAPGCHRCELHLRAGHLVRPQHAVEVREPRGYGAAGWRSSAFHAGEPSTRANPPGWPRRTRLAAGCQAPVQLAVPLRWRRPWPVQTCRGREIFCSGSAAPSCHWASQPGTRPIANSTGRRCEQVSQIPATSGMLIQVREHSVGEHLAATAHAHIFPAITDTAASLTSGQLWSAMWSAWSFCLGRSTMLVRWRITS
jgi:hypothetical protein